MSFASGQQGPSKHNWPDYLVFFSQLEPTLRNLLRSSSYAECYRSWNTAWHDDWRRKGDMVIWCLDPSVQQGWREQNKLIHEASWKKAMEKHEMHFDRILDGFKKEASLGWERGTRSTPSWSRPKWSQPVESASSWYGRWQWPWASRKDEERFYWKSQWVPYWEQLTTIWRRPSKTHRHLWS